MVGCKRPSIFSTAATKSRSLHPPPAAVALFARTSGARVRVIVIHQNKSTTRMGGAFICLGYKKDIFAIFAYEFELSQILNL